MATASGGDGGSPGDRRSAFYPGRAPIEAYGNGGFRFADMSHRGSILCLPSGIMAWDAVLPDDICEEALSPVLAQAHRIGVLLIGTGSRQVFMPPPLKAFLAGAGIGVEPMSTGSAARTYNVLLAENRPVAAALLAVE